MTISSVLLYLGLALLIIMADRASYNRHQETLKGIDNVMSVISDYVAAQNAAIARIQADITAIGAKLRGLRARAEPDCPRRADGHAAGPHDVHLKYRPGR